MANRVIKDSIWTSPTLAALSDFADGQFPRWLLLPDDWGCFNSDSRVIKGMVYPLRDSVTVKKIDALKQEYHDAGILFLWTEGGREWCYFVSFDNHHNYCNKTNADEDGKRQKHRRKTPEPPAEALAAYLKAFFVPGDALGKNGAAGNKKLNPNPNPNPNPNSNPKVSVGLESVERGELATKTQEIFAYWQQTHAHPKAMLDEKRAKAIKSRLNEGYTVERIKSAIRGIKLSGYHMGKNDRNTVYDDIELICREGKRLDNFADLDEKARARAAPSKSQWREISDTLSDEQILANRQRLQELTASLGGRAVG